MIIIWILLVILIISAASVIFTRRTKKNKKIINLGRDETCDIQVDHCFDDVSRIHASIYIKDNKLIFEDKSSNGSYVNEQKVHLAQQIINRYDQIKLGESCVVPMDDIIQYFPDYFIHTGTFIKK